MFHKIKQLFKKKEPEVLMTVKGKYLFKYLDSIVKGLWTEKDFIQSYEDDIASISKMNNITREQAVFILWSHLKVVMEQTQGKIAEDEDY